MNKTTYTTTRFDVNDEFYVEVSPDGEVIDFFLCMQDCGIKTYMFGFDKNDCPEDMWEQLIEDNVEDYIKEFLKDIDYLENRPNV